jgi:hypothetical protein
MSNVLKGILIIGNVLIDLALVAGMIMFDGDKCIGFGVTLFLIFIMQLIGMMYITD